MWEQGMIELETERWRDSVRKMWGRKNNLLLEGEEMHRHLHQRLTKTGEKQC